VQSLSYAPNCFNGTSSSTPVTAGAAALALSAGAADSPQTLKTFLLNSTIDRGSPGSDNVFGRGELLLPDPRVAVGGSAPSVTALKSRGRRGHRARLRYRVTDDGGVSREVVTVIRKARVLKRIRTEFGEATGDKYAVVWKVPKSGNGDARFCVVATDPSGNQSATDCAKINIVRN
jgi:hypothetical protein